MRNGHSIPYEKAETAKTCLHELLHELLHDNATMKEIEQLDTIIGKLEAWQKKFSK